MWDLFAIASLAVAAVILGVFLANAHPPATYDTGHYFSAARNLASGHGLVSSITSLDNPALTEPLKRWPPLYSVLWAGVLLLGGGPLTSGGIVSAFAFAATVAGTGALGRRMGGRVAGVLAATFALTSVGFWLMSATALSDMLYTGFVVWSIYLLAAYTEDERPWQLVASAICAAAAAMTRWVGFTLAVSGALWLLLLAVRSRRWRDSVLSVAYGALAAAPLVLWQLVNPISKGIGALRPSPGQAPFATNVAQYAATLAADLGLFARNPSRAAILLMVVRWVLVVMVAVALAAATRRWLAEGGATGLALALPGVIAWVTYVGVVAYTRSIQYVPYLVTRYVAPFFPVGFAAAAATVVWLAKLPAVENADRRWRTAGVAAAAVLALAAPPYLVMGSNARIIRQGVEVTSPTWREDPTMAFLRRRSPDVVFSPVASFVYTLTELPGMRLPDGTSAADAYAALGKPPLAGHSVLLVLELPARPGAPSAVDVPAYLASPQFVQVFRSSHTVVLEARAAGGG